MSVVYAVVAILLAVLALDRFAPATAARWGLRLDRWRSGLRERQVTIPGFTMPYLEGGHGEPLVLIHGFGGDKDNFTRVARFLTPHYRVICPDLPGFGGATRDPSARYGIADQVARLHAFMDELKLDRVHLGGSSMGGFIVAQFAANHADQVRSLWLLDPAGTAAANTSEIGRNYLATGEMPLLVAAKSQFPALLRAAMHVQPFLPYSLRITLARRAVADYTLHRQILAEFAGESPLLETQFAALNTPALIVWGSEDRVLDPAGAEAMRKLFPNSEVILMADIGHLPMMEAPLTAAKDHLAFRRSARFA
jgi:pimeloyl-ACP methyl ester carboxylesterase